jgi:plastocyanin
MRRWAAVLTVSGVVFAGLAANAAARSQVVYAGGQPAFQAKMGKQFAVGEALQFFPSTVTVHVGDTVVWQGMSIGFHTIDLPARHSGALPLIAPIGGPVSGILDAAGNPFWFNNGKLPQLGFNPALLAPSGGHVYTGAARVDSGLPFGPPRSFKVRFTRVGRYAYFCDVHPGMHGLVTVLPQHKPIPSAARNAAAVAKQQAADVVIAKHLSKTKIHGNRVSLGVASKHVEILRMFQGVVQVPVGTTVTFAMPTTSSETHTASFGPAAYLNTLAQGFDTPSIDARSVYPSSPPPGPIAVNQTSHGNGFANTGALQAAKGSPLPALGKITFTQPGTYNFQCLIHPFMHGSIVVK